MNENHELIIKVLKERSCLTSKEICKFAKQIYDVDLTPSCVTGLLRTLYNKNYLEKSKNEHGTMVYWLI